MNYEHYNFFKVFHGGLQAGMVLTPVVIQAAKLLPPDDRYGKAIHLAMEWVRINETLSEINSDDPRFAQIDKAARATLRHLLDNFPIKITTLKAEAEWLNEDALCDLSSVWVSIAILKDVITFYKVRATSIPEFEEFANRYGGMLIS